MEMIPKSQVLRKALQEIVTGAVIEGNLMDELFKIAMALVAQEFLEQEVTDFLVFFCKPEFPRRVSAPPFGHI